MPHAQSPTRPDPRQAAALSSLRASATASAAVGLPLLPDREVQVLLCEDHPVYLAGLRALLRPEPGVHVAGVVDNLAAACLVAARVPGSLVVVVRQGLLPEPPEEALSRLRGEGAVVLVLAETDDEPALVEALRAGVRGYLSRRLTAVQLLDAIRSLARNEPAFDSGVARHLVRLLTSDGTNQAPTSPPTPLQQLTARQREVARLVGRGLTNEEIAATLHVTLATVKSHLAAVMRRLDIRSRTQLAILVGREEAAAGPRASDATLRVV